MNETVFLVSLDYSLNEWVFVCVFVCVVERKRETVVCETTRKPFPHITPGVADQLIASL